MRLIYRLDRDDRKIAEIDRNRRRATLGLSDTTLPTLHVGPGRSEALSTVIDCYIGGNRRKQNAQSNQCRFANNSSRLPADSMNLVGVFEYEIDLYESKQDVDDNRAKTRDRTSHSSLSNNPSTVFATFSTFPAFSAFSVVWILKCL